MHNTMSNIKNKIKYLWPYKMPNSKLISIFIAFNLFVWLAIFGWNDSFVRKEMKSNQPRATIK